MPPVDADYSRRDPCMFDRASRLAQAQKIARVLGHFAAAEAQAAPETGLLAAARADLRALDVGCSSGIITGALAQRWSWGLTVGVDVDRAALSAASGGAHAHFAAARAAALPFPARSFHIAVCNQVYQYVPDVHALLAELARVLQPGGICYFGARNLWGIASPQNWAPFLAARAPWLVRRGAWAHRAGALWSYRRLRRAAARHFAVHDYTLRVLTDPAFSDLFVPPRGRVWLARAPRAILALVKPFLPTHIWLLQKPSDP